MAIVDLASTAAALVAEEQENTTRRVGALPAPIGVQRSLYKKR
jgi:hypothetical protein